MKISVLMLINELLTVASPPKKGFEKLPLGATKPLYESRAAFLLLCNLQV
jgi:hypothetical protein